MSRYAASAALVASLLVAACSLPQPSPSEAPRLHPSEVPRTQGDGWRQLGIFRTQVPSTVRLAQTEEELSSELDWHQIAADLPGWDPGTEVIAFFSQAIGSSCPEVAISDIAFDSHGRVYATFVDPVAAANGGTPRACAANEIGSQTVVVALARDHLPASSFTLQLEEAVIGCHPDCGYGPSAITVNVE